MPLESVGEKLIEAVERLIVVMEESNAGRAEVLAAAQAATAPKTQTAAQKKAAEAAAAEAAKASAPAAEESDATALTLDKVKDIMAKYVGQQADEPEREARKLYAFEVIGKVGAKKATEIPEDKFDIVHRTFANLIEKNERRAPTVEEAGGSDDLLG